ncbi:MAG: SoxR reducing system RseC family protein [Deltaproteobacteria bacterium]|nr:SoxR reducing system RseC family protein [Deltaproteobacteria bacterium]
MIEEIGTVVELKKGQVALVHCRKSSACKGCPSANLCSLGHDDGDRRVEAHNALEAKLGERVRIATTTKAFYQSSFLIYIVPLIGLVLGALLGQKLGPRMEVDPNIPALLIGVLFLVGSFLGIRYLNRFLSKEDYMPTVVEILHEEEGGNAGCAENL